MKQIVIILSKLKLSRLGGILLAFGLAILISNAQVPTSPKDQAPKASRELIQDPGFERGFILLDPNPGKRVPYGVLTNSGDGRTPVWDLAQWSSRFPITTNDRVQSTCITNQGKVVVFGSNPPADGCLVFGVNGLEEYGNHARNATEPWVHLLAQQTFTNPPSVGDLTNLVLHLDAKLDRVKKLETPDYNPGLHAAQYQMFLSVQNLNKQSAGYGQYLWFGIPIYDDRHRTAPHYQSQDTGGTSMYIFTPAGSLFSTRSTHDKEWITIHRDILPLIRNGLNSAWAAGFLKESHDYNDYWIAGMNIGWEVPGLFDAQMRIRKLSLRAE